MLTITNLHVKDTIFDHELIHGLSMSVNEGDKVAIIGSEGTGKSTLLKLIAGYQLDYVTVKGTIDVLGKIAHIEQNITYRSSDKTVYDFLYEEEEERIDQLDYIVRRELSSLGLEYDEVKDRIIASFSGGEKVKLSLVKAVMKDPELLLFDEPTNDLDFETIAFLEDFMKRTTIPLVFISHDQRLLEEVANSIVHLQHIHKLNVAKTYVFKGSYLDYKARFFRAFESNMQKARKERSDYDKKMKSFRQIYAKVEHQQNQAVRNPPLARLLKKKIHSLKSQQNRYIKEQENWTEFPIKEEPMNIFFDDQKRVNKQKRMIDLTFPVFSLRNGKCIHNLHLSVRGGEKMVVYGKNGVGKTTFIEQVVKDLRNKQISVGYIPQNYVEELDPAMSVVDFLLSRQETYKAYRIRQILGQLGFKRKEMDDKIQDISEGQKLKVLLLLIVSMKPDILILDEPTRNISPLNQDEIYDLFLQFDGSIVAVTHDRAFIERVFDQMVEFTEHGLIEQ